MSKAAESVESSQTGMRAEVAETAETSAPPRLAAVLGPGTALAIVVGATIGTGIFMKPNQVAQATGGALGVILGLWVLCGLVNLCGALTLAELSAMMPHAGGAYVFLREAYGKLWAFLWVWGEFWVIRSGAVAALGHVFAQALVGPWAAGQGMSPAATAWVVKLAACVTILVLATINVLGTRWGGGLQVLTTVLKAAALALVMVLPWVGQASRVPWTHYWPEQASLSYWAALGTALAGIMWAYDGWGMVTVMAEEIRDPQRNVPRSLGGGLLLLILLYVGAVVAYHLTLPAEVIARSDIPAAAVAEAQLPGWGERLVLGTLLVSALGALNSNILVGPRVLFAAARDHRALARWSRVDPRTGTPAVAILTQSLWAVLLILAGDVSRAADRRLFDVLTEYAIFGGSVFYFAAVVAVFVLRRSRPEWPRPYRTWGYPWVPLVFCGFYVALLASMLLASPREALFGLLLIGLGAPAYRMIADSGGEA